MKAILVPGQGKHTSELVKSNHEEVRYWFNAVEDICKTKISSENIHHHDINSLCILAYAFGSHKRFLAHHPETDFVAGYSVGQFAALGIAGVLSFENCLNLVKERSGLMLKYKQDQMGMLSILGLELRVIEDLIQTILSNKIVSDQCYLEISNFNAPYNYTISGDLDSLRDLEKLGLINKCKKAELIPVEGAWHSRMLKTAVPEYSSLLDKFQLSQPKISYVDNFSGKIESLTQTIKENLLKHLHCPVQWDQTMQTLIEGQVSECFIAGPGNQVQTMFMFKDRKIKQQPIF